MDIYTLIQMESEEDHDHRNRRRSESSDGSDVDQGTNACVCLCVSDCGLLHEHCWLTFQTVVERPSRKLKRPAATEDEASEAGDDSGGDARKALQSLTI